MGDKEIKKYLRRRLQQETEFEQNKDKKLSDAEKRNKDKKLNDTKSQSNVKKLNEEKKFSETKLEETVKLCVEIMREQKSQEEPRIGFAQYLSDIFRFEGMPIFGIQAVTLFVICVAIYGVAGNPSFIPVFMPLFVLAVMPTIFKCQYYGMSEIEAVTRASGSQIVLAKLILAGAANLVCITLFISFELHLRNSYTEISQLILYCMVPYLVCMVSMLRLIRLRRTENMKLCFCVMLGSCVCWGVLAKTLPWLYDISAFGIWIVAFLFFATFFIKEVYFIIAMRKEGKMYEIIS